MVYLVNFKVRLAALKIYHLSFSPKMRGSGSCTVVALNSAGGLLECTILYSLGLFGAYSTKARPYIMVRPIRD